MESTTLFLAQLWGPAILAIGLGVMVNKGHYTRIYREIQRESEQSFTRLLDLVCYKRVRTGDVDADAKLCHLFRVPCLSCRPRACVSVRVKEETGRSHSGPVRETYLVGPRDTSDPAAWRTEIGWPVFRVAQS